MNSVLLQDVRPLNRKNDECFSLDRKLTVGVFEGGSLPCHLTLLTATDSIVLIKP